MSKVSQSRYNLLDSVTAESILVQLFKHAVFSKKETSEDLVEATITLGSYNSAYQDFDDEPGDIVKETLRQLQQSGVIKEYSDFFRGDQDPEDYETAYTNCSYYPSKVVTQLENIWSPRKTTIAKILPLYQKFTELVFEYMRSNKTPTRELNESYISLKETMLGFSKNLSGEISYRFYIPYKDLFSARKEMEDKKTTVKGVVNRMLDFYGKLVESEKSFSIATYAKTELDLERVDQLINSLKENLPKHRAFKDSGVKQPYAGELKISNQAGSFAYYNDGSIRYEGKEIEMRQQIKELCRMFIDSPNQIITIDDIKDAVIHAKRRKSTTNETIAKYISELRKLLKMHSGKEVLTNIRETGWRLDI